MPNWFNRPLKMPKVRTSVHHLPRDYKTSIRFGEAIPVDVREILPSDSIIRNNKEIYAQLAPLRFPTMHQMHLNTHDFFVPLRIILGDDRYEQFLNGEHALPSCSFTTKVSDYSEDMLSDYSKNPFLNTLFDYLAYDILDCEHTTLSEEDYITINLENGLPIFAYLITMRDWFCDSNIETDFIDKITTLIDSYRDNFSADSDFSFSYYWDLDSLIEVFKVSYTKDYFNTARPTPQMGPDMYVLNRPLKLGGSAVKYGPRNVFDTEDQLSGYSASALYREDATAVSGTLSEDTSIRDLWRKEMLQRFYEVDNTFGSRVREKLAGHFGVIISDKRLQIPLYLGGSKSVVQVDSVIQTSSTSGEDTPLGTRGGKASVYRKTASRKCFFEEHGVYLSILSVVPDNGYCNGQDRFYFKKDIFDFAFPEFNNIGWQEVYDGEIYHDGTASNLRNPFGYQPRYSDYRTAVSRVTGSFRTAALIGWHMNRYFSDKPVLNENFIKVADSNRIFAYEGMSDNDCPIFLDVYSDITMSRPIAYEPDSLHLY